MNETTEFIQRAKPDSHFMNISIRAWLALGLIWAIISHSAAKMVVVIIFSLHLGITAKEAVELLDVKEPLYTMAGMALAYYFGQQQKKTTT